MMQFSIFSVTFACEHACMSARASCTSSLSFTLSHSVSLFLTCSPVPHAPSLPLLAQVPRTAFIPHGEWRQQRWVRACLPACLPACLLPTSFPALSACPITSPLTSAVLPSTHSCRPAGSFGWALASLVAAVLENMTVNIYFQVGPGRPPRTGAQARMYAHNATAKHGHTHRHSHTCTCTPLQPHMDAATHTHTAP